MGSHRRLFHRFLLRELAKAFKKSSATGRKLNSWPEATTPS
jgi:hypothetical protein